MTDNSRPPTARSDRTVRPLFSLEAPARRSSPGQGRCCALSLNRQAGERSSPTAAHRTGWRVDGSGRWLERRCRGRRHSDHGAEQPGSRRIRQHRWGWRRAAGNPVLRGASGWKSRVGQASRLFLQGRFVMHPGRAGMVARADPSRWSSPANRMPAPAQLLSHQPDKGCTVMGEPAALGGKPKRPARQSCRSPDSSSAVRALPRRPFGRAGPPCSASSRRRERDAGLLSVWLSLAALVPVRTTERQRA